MDLVSTRLSRENEKTEIYARPVSVSFPHLPPRALKYIVRQLAHYLHNSTWFSAVRSSFRLSLTSADCRALLLCLSTYFTPDGYIIVATILFVPITTF